MIGTAVFMDKEVQGFRVQRSTFDVRRSIRSRFRLGGISYEFSQECLTLGFLGTTNNINLRYQEEL